MLVFGFGVAAGMGVLYLDQRSRNASASKAEREIGEALQKPGIRLAGAADEIRALENDFVRSDLESRAQIKSLEVMLHHLRENPPRAQQNPDEIKIAASVACLEDAARALDAASLDPDFNLLDETLGLRVAVDSSRGDLVELGAGPDLVKRILDGLERGRFDHLLTTASFLEAYFIEKPRWQGLYLAYRSVEALLVGLLQGKGVQIVRLPPLSIVTASEMRDAAVSERRNIKRILAVRHTAARVARDLDNNEFLVVDCHAPGWISTLHIGSRPPGFAVFDRSSWT
jgi:hypothetical protein